MILSRDLLSLGWGQGVLWGGSPDFRAKRIPVFCQSRTELDTMSLKPGFLMHASSDLNIQVYVLVSYPNCLRTSSAFCMRARTHTHAERETHVHLSWLVCT